MFAGLKYFFILLIVVAREMSWEGNNKSCLCEKAIVDSESKGSKPEAYQPSRRSSTRENSKEVNPTRKSMLRTHHPRVGFPVLNISPYSWVFFSSLGLYLTPTNCELHCLQALSSLWSCTSQPFYWLLPWSWYGELHPYCQFSHDHNSRGQMDSFFHFHYPHCYHVSLVLNTCVTKVYFSLWLVCIWIVFIGYNT